MSIIQCTAPFRGENTPDEKKAFIDGHQGPIEREYIRATGKKPVRHVTCHLHVMSLKKIPPPAPREDQVGGGAFGAGEGERDTTPELQGGPELGGAEDSNTFRI